MTQMPPIDLAGDAPVHVVGCGGTGMAPITAVVAHLGVPVSGSDQRTTTTTDALAALGVIVTDGADYGAIPEDAAIVRSTAVPNDHPEIAAARAAGRAVYRRADLLAALTRLYRTVSIAGTHGKTTTSAMTTAALIGCGVPVTSVVGGTLLGVDQAVPGAVLGEVGGVLVVEADESDGTFVELATDIAVVTNIEPDHLEYYGGQVGLFAAFDSFISGPHLSHLVLCRDDEGVRAAVERTRVDHGGVRWYGEDVEADVRLRFEPSGSSIRVSSPDQESTDHWITPKLPGRHNALNLTAAIGVVSALGLDVAAAAAALNSFDGVGRRFELRGTANDIRVVDDYAHLHSEIAAAIRAARDVCSGRIHVVFQPHRFSRTAALWNTYGEALIAADSLVITDIYSSGEAPRPGIDADLIADDIRHRAPDLPLRRIGSPSEVPAALAAVAEPGDLCLLLSAGDLPSIAPDVVAALDDAS